MVFFFYSPADMDEQPTSKLSDLMPRVDISPQITEALLAEMSDKNWKTRNEGLTKLQGKFKLSQMPSQSQLILKIFYRNFK